MENGKIKTHNLAFAYAGCYVGAGFLSGQELWQFFGSFGKNGLIGLILALIIQGIIGTLILIASSKSKNSDFSKIIIEKDNSIVRYLFIFLEMFFIFSIVMIMIAGAGSLLESAFKINNFLASLIFAIIIGAVSCFGINGVVKIFSATVPLLTVMTVVVSALALCKYGFPSLENAQVTGGTLMLPNFVISFILFATYNLFCSLGVIVPIGCKIQEKTTAIKGVVVANIILILISFSVLMPIYSQNGFASKDLPMLAVAKDVNSVLFYVYAILMFMGIFGTSVSNTVALLEFSMSKSKVIKQKKYLFVIPVILLAFILSRFGFSTLIGVIYPLSGYVGIIAFILIAYNYFKKGSSRSN